MAETKQQEQAQAAPQNVQSAAVSQQPVQQGRPCPKDCRKCPMAQQVCCSSMLSFQAFEVMNGMIQRLDIQSQRIADLEAKLAAIQSSEAELSSPLPFQGDIFAGQE